MNALDQTLSAQEEYFSMGSVVDQCCNDLGISVPHYFQKLLSWGMWELVQLKMDTANCVKPIILDVSDVLTCTVPADAVDVVTVGLISGQYVKPLTRATNLSLLDRTTATFNPSRVEPPGWLPNGVDFNSYGGFQFANFHGRALWAIGGGLPQRGHYAVVDCGTCKQIYLDAGVACTNQVYVEYIGLGISQCNEDTIVGPYLAEFVRCAIHHSFEKWGRGKDKSEAAIQRTGIAMAFAEQKARGRVSGLDIPTLQTLQRRSYRLTNHV